MRALLHAVLEDLMGTEVDHICRASYGERSEVRENSRNGYRPRRFDTRVGTIDLPIPKLRSGSYFPDWLLDRKKRAEKALISIVAFGSLARRPDRDRPQAHGASREAASGVVARLPPTEGQRF